MVVLGHGYVSNHISKNAGSTSLGDHRITGWILIAHCIGSYARANVDVDDRPNLTTTTR